MMKKLRLLAVSALLAAFAAQSGAYAAVSPLNPDFVEYINQAKSNVKNNNVATLSAAPNAALHERGGYVPSPLNWSHLDGKTWSVYPGGDEAAEARRAAASELPVYYLSGENTAQTPSDYDLRGEMPAVRNQTGFGNCWAHSAMAATESNLIVKGLADTSIDLSEWYLTYYSFLPCGDMPGFTIPPGVEFYDVGGNDWLSVALLSRCCRAVRVPYRQRTSLTLWPNMTTAPKPTTTAAFTSRRSPRANGNCRTRSISATPVEKKSSFPRRAAT